MMAATGEDEELGPRFAGTTVDEVVGSSDLLTVVEIAVEGLPV